MRLLTPAAAAESVVAFLNVLESANLNVVLHVTAHDHYSGSIGPAEAVVNMLIQRNVVATSVTPKGQTEVFLTAHGKDVASKLNLTKGSNT